MHLYKNHLNYIILTNIKCVKTKMSSYSMLQQTNYDLIWVNHNLIVVAKDKDIIVQMYR